MLRVEFLAETLCGVEECVPSFLRRVMFKAASEDEGSETCCLKAGSTSLNVATRRGPWTSPAQTMG